MSTRLRLPRLEKLPLCARPVWYRLERLLLTPHHAQRGQCMMALGHIQALRHRHLDAETRKHRHAGRKRR